MSTKSMRIWSIISGALLIAAGIYCLCNQDVAVMSAGLLLGVFMLISGIAEIVGDAQSERITYFIHSFSNSTCYSLFKLQK